MQKITDPLGNTTTLTFDSTGNAIREVNASGGITTRTFDADGNLLSETIVVGEEDSPANGETDDLKSVNTYDSSGNLETYIDGRGNTVFFSYNQYGQMLTSTDPSGNTVRNNYDQYGNLRSSTDPNGVSRSFSYDDDGNLTTVTDDAGRIVTTNAYNRYGELTGTTDAFGNVKNFTYDVSGNPQEFSYSHGEGANQVEIVERTEYDDAGRAISTSQVRKQGTATETLWTKSVKHNAAGQVEREVDRHGTVTEYVYDHQGRKIETRIQMKDADGLPQWLIERVVYDALGRVILRTDQYAEGAAVIFGTRTYDDPLGGVDRAERRKDVVVAFEGTAPNLKSVIASEGTLAADDGAQFDAQGRLVSMTDRNGMETRYTYNTVGELIETRTQAPDENGTLVWLVKRTVYDELGRKSIVTDRYIDGSSTPVFATRTVYDAKGRGLEEHRLEGVTVDIAGGDAVLANAGTIITRTKTVYNERGQVAQTIAADGQTTDYEYDEFGRRAAVIGPAAVDPGSGVLVRHRTELVYNDQSRVWKERINIRQYEDGSKDATGVRETLFEYDEFGRFVKRTFPDGTFTERTYTASGQVATEKDQMGLVREYQYDDKGRLSAVVLPEIPDPQNGNQPTKPTYQYEYDEFGNQTLVRDPLGRETGFTYDNRGQQLARTLPLGFGPDGIKGTADDSDLPEGDFTERFVYDDEGRVVQQTSFEGVVTKFVHDAGTGRLKEKQFFAGSGAPDETWFYKYDAFGRVVEVQQQKGADVRTTVTSHDPEGRITQVNSPEGTVNYEYDDFGRRVRTSTGDPLNPTNDTRYAYDARGWLETVTVWARNGVVLPEAEREVTRYEYDLLGNRQRSDRQIRLHAAERRPPFGRGRNPLVGRQRRWHYRSAYQQLRLVIR